MGAVLIMTQGVTCDEELFAMSLRRPIARARLAAVSARRSCWILAAAYALEARLSAMTAFTAPCTWCGEATGNYCDECGEDFGSRAVCTVCDEEFTCCRVCFQNSCDSCDAMPLLSVWHEITTQMLLSFVSRSEF